MHEHHHDEHTSVEHTGAGHHHLFDSPEMAEFAELDGEVLIGLTTKAASVLADLCRREGVDVRRLLDLGCGPGIGTACLAELFGSANVVAVDSSATMLEHATARAERLGLGGRVETRLAELPDGLRTLGRVDAAWASMALHHVGDEVAALRLIHSLLEPRGILAVVEMARPVRVLPDEVDLGRPGLWERLDAAWATWFAGMRAELPGATASGDYPAMLQQAGFEVLVDEVLSVTLDPPLDARARAFAHRQLLSARTRLEPSAAAGDLEALDVLLDPEADEGILRRGDVQLRAARHLYVARPSSAGV